MKCFISVLSSHRSQNHQILIMISKKLKIDFTDLKIENEVRSNCDNPVKINILGDWTPSTEKLGSFMIEKGENYYEDLLHYFHDSDLNVTNLETVIDNMDAGIESHGSRFINKKETLDSMKSIRMDLVCLANNHMMDNGEEGLRSTRKSLDEYSIQYIGAGFNDDEIYNPFLFDGKGIRIAIINAADGECANEKYNDNKGVADIDSFRIVDCIRKHKKNSFSISISSTVDTYFICTIEGFQRKKKEKCGHYH